MGETQKTLEPIMFEASCCASRRECNVRKHLVISLKTKKILREIEAVRCGRGEVKKYKFYPSDSVALVEYYVSNRGVLHLKILWKPNNVSDVAVEEATKKATGWWQEEEIYT